ncbi:MAG: hypothetical protein ACR2PX_21385 [Endozoicomonas sp.]|uniref:hypothetical protein n=1 Tax=Endozoicomonas sp. TaxID=1892382 RepID=UPI003D9BF0F9
MKNNKNRKYLSLVLGAVSVLALSGCATFENPFAPPKRQIQDNALYSSNNPNGVINVDQNLEYLGMVPVSEWERYANNTGGSYQYRDSYIFASKDDDNVIDKSVTINLWTIGSGYWIPGFEKDGFVQIDKYIRGNQRFDTGVFHTTITRDDDVSMYLEDSNYLLPSCMVFKSYQKVFSPGRNAKNKMTISYGEPILCEKTIMFLPENKNTERTQAFLKAFNKKADSSFQTVSFN